MKQICFNSIVTRLTPDLGWHPRWGVEKTLSATADWYKSLIDGGNAENVTRAQVHDYFPELL